MTPENRPLATREPSNAELIAAAEAVIKRWDSPNWSNQPHTAVFIERLRKAVEAAK